MHTLPHYTNWFATAVQRVSDIVFISTPWHPIFVNSFTSFFCRHQRSLGCGLHGPPCIIFYFSLCEKHSQINNFSFIILFFACELGISDPICSSPNIYACYCDFMWTSCPVSTKTCGEKITEKRMDTAYLFQCNLLLLRNRLQILVEKIATCSPSLNRAGRLSALFFRCLNHLLVANTTV